MDGTLLTQSFIILNDREIMYHSLNMQKSCSEPRPYGLHIGWRGFTSVQGGILADYDQIDTHVLKWNPTTFGHPKFLHIWATRDWDIPSKLRFDAIYIRRCVTSVQGGILADYDQNFSRGWDSPDTKFQLPQRPGNYVPLTLYMEILFWANALRTHIGWRGVAKPRQFRAAYWLITTKLIHMSWSEILPSLFILSLFTFELHVIEIFLPNSVLMLYIRRCPSWCHVSSGRHIGWLRPKLKSWMGLSWHKVSASSNTGKLCTTHFICGNPALSHRLADPILADVVSHQFRAAYWLISTILIHMSWSEILPSLVILSLFTFELHVIEIFLPSSVLMLYIRRLPSWYHVSSGPHIGWLRPKL